MLLLQKSIIGAASSLILLDFSNKKPDKYYHVELTKKFFRIPYSLSSMFNIIQEISNTVRST